MFTEDAISELVEKAIEAAFDKFKLEKYEEAEIILYQTLKVAPKNQKALQLFGLAKHNNQKYQEAINIFQEAIEIDVNNAENYNNLGLCYANMGDYKAATEMIKKALELNPKCSYMHSNLGLQYRHLNEIELAIDCFKKSLDLEQTDLTWGMLGGCYGERKELKEAENCFKKAIELNPNFAGAHVDLANVYHLQGRWDEAWEEYEWRDQVFEQLKVWKNLYDPNKKWAGQDLKGKKIVIHGEQGFGDTIQFFRYVSCLKDAYTILHCNEDLGVLFKKYVNEVFVEEPALISKDALPEHDYHCSILSLPYLLKVKETPNFQLEIEESFELQEFSNFFKVGIVWAGNPQHPNDKNRSCHLSYFKKLEGLPNVKLFSLVKDVRPRIYRFSKEIVDLISGTEEMKIIDLSSNLKNYIETSKIINSLDLVITVDTSVLHLAGSLGKKTWGLIPYNSDWRWGQNSKSTIWYPSVELFRQSKPGDWEGVFNEVFLRLKELL